jgi:hypothetical protein
LGVIGIIYKQGISMRNPIKLLILLLLVLFLTGCKSTLLVKTTTVEQLIPILKDYVGIHGYQLTYQNDQTASYRVYLGTVYIPNVSQTTKTSQISEKVSSDNVNQSVLTGYEQTTWQTVSVPGHYVEASVMVKVLQQDKDALIIVDSNDSVGSSLSDLAQYIQTLGYSVENK